MRSFVVKTQPVDGIHRIKLDLAPFDEIAERLHHPLAFQFPFIARARRKAQQGRAPVAVDRNTQLQSEPLGIPALIFAFHLCLLLAAGRESMPA